jgi:hypothetical protein
MTSELEDAEESFLHSLVVLRWGHVVAVHNGIEIITVSVQIPLQK